MAMAGGKQGAVEGEHVHLVYVSADGPYQEGAGVQPAEGRHAALENGRAELKMIKNIKYF